MKVEHEYTPEPIYKLSSKHIFDVQPGDIFETTHHQKYLPERHGGNGSIGDFAVPEANYIQKYVICPLCEMKIQIYSKEIKSED